MPGLRGKPAVMTTMSESAGWLVIVRAGDHDVIAFDWAGFEQVQALALRHAFHDVDEHDIGEFLIGDAQRAVGADIAGAYDGNFFPHG